MCVNDVPFVTSPSENIHYGAVEVAGNLKYHSLELKLIGAV